MVWSCDSGRCCTAQSTTVLALSVHREQMESQLEKEARFRQLMAHSSHDSAIDTDSMEWETEVVEFERETVSCLGWLCCLAFLNVKTVWGKRGWPHGSAPISQLPVWRVGFSSWEWGCSCLSWVTAGCCPRCLQRTRKVRTRAEHQQRCQQDMCLQWPGGRWLLCLHLHPRDESVAGGFRSHVSPSAW